MSVLGTGTALTQTVKNVGTTVIPANRFCLLHTTDIGTVVGASTAFPQSGTGTIGGYASVHAIAGSAGGTGVAADVYGVTVGPIRPGQLGTIIVRGPAIVEVASTFAVEAQDPVQASSNSTGSLQGQAEAVSAGDKVGVVIVEIFQHDQGTFNFGGTSKYYAIVDVHNRTAIGLDLDTDT